MSGSRLIAQLMSIAMLFLWSGVLLFFYYTDRLRHYMPQEGIFQPMVLVAGIGLAVLGLFNLLTANSEEPTADSHPGAGCCGGHDHTHSHEKAKPASHDQGLLEESSWSGRLIALLILAAPLTWAAFKTPDRMSEKSIMNKGVYSQDYSRPASSGKFSLRNDAAPATAPKAPAAATTPPVAVATSSTPPAAASIPAMASAPPSTSAPASTPPSRPTPVVTSGPPAPAPGATPELGTATTEALSKASATPSGAASTQSYGKFSLADLEAQVPRSKDGNFILEVPEIYYTAGDAEVQGVIAGQSVETIAQVLPEKVNNADGHRLRIFRLLVQCCAADARPYSVPVDFGKKAPEFKDMSWVKVVGKMSFRKEGNQTVPVIEGTQIEATTAPENAMISQ